MKTDRSGNYIGNGSYHVEPHIFDLAAYPMVYAKVSESETTETVYVYYTNRDNDKRVTVRFSDHVNNAVQFGDQLDGNFASLNEVLFRLDLKTRVFVPKTRLSIWWQSVAKKRIADYEEADLTIKEMYALGADADLSAFNGKLAKGSNYLIMGNKVECILEEKINSMGQKVTLGDFIYK